jgi:hypothetical protein
LYEKRRSYILFICQLPLILHLSVMTLFMLFYYIYMSVCYIYSIPVQQPFQEKWLNKDPWACNWSQLVTISMWGITWPLKEHFNPNQNKGPINSFILWEYLELIRILSTCYVLLVFPFDVVKHHKVILNAWNQCSSWSWQEHQNIIKDVKISFF